MNRMHHLLVLVAVAVIAPAVAAGTVVEVSDARNLHGTSTVVPSGGDAVSDLQIIAPPEYFGPFDDDSSVVLDGAGVYAYAYATQQSEALIPDGLLMGTGTATIQLGAEGVDASASGNTCSHFIIMFQVGANTAFDITGVLSSNDATSGGPDSWAHLTLEEAYDNVIVLEEVQAGIGELPLDISGILPAGLYRLTVEAHATGEVTEWLDGEADSGFDVTMTFSELCLGDVDGSGDVGANDLAALLGSWGPCDDCSDCPGETEGNCHVGSTDLANLLGNWGVCE